MDALLLLEVFINIKRFVQQEKYIQLMNLRSFLDIPPKHVDENLRAIAATNETSNPDEVFNFVQQSYDAEAEGEGEEKEKKKQH